MTWEFELETALRNQGFSSVGICDLNAAQALFAKAADRFSDWTERGFAGSMAYLLKTRAKRTDPQLWVPHARTVVAVLYPYPSHATTHDPLRPKLARYLSGPDYHHVMRTKFETTLRSVRAVGENFRVSVDAEPVLERAWAAICGLGFIGKNTLLIHPTLGSHFFIAIAFLQTTTERQPQFIAQRCGSCERCLTACPTRAFPAAGVLDARRCISHLTLEHRGDATGFTEKLDAGWDWTWLAGCDVCQDVCPFNTKAFRAPLRLPLRLPVRSDEQAVSSKAGDPCDPWQEWVMLIPRTRADFDRWVQGRALDRMRFSQFARNVSLGLQAALSAARDLGQFPNAEARRELESALDDLIGALGTDRSGGAPVAAAAAHATKKVLATHSKTENSDRNLLRKWKAKGHLSHLER